MKNHLKLKQQPDLMAVIKDHVFALNEYVIFIGSQYSGKCYQLMCFHFWPC